MTAIEVDGLTRTFGDVVAVDGLTFAVEEGEVFGFLGPNGAGKSTTINVLLGFLEPTAGSARILGCDVESESLAARERIGVLPEGATPYERLTGREHLQFVGRIKGTDPDVDRILDRVGLSPADAGRPAGDYSKGMAQRLGLGMALVGDPDLLVLDEPSSGLDPTGMREMRQLIAEEAERGTTVFFSSHILAEVEAVSDRIGILDDGRLVAEDHIDALRERSGGGCTIELVVEASPDESFALTDIAGVVDATVEGDSIVVTCEDATVKADVVRRVGERATITDVVTEERSLESLFEEYTTGGVTGSAAGTGDHGDGEAPEVEA